MEVNLGSVVVLGLLYASHCLRLWLRGRARPSTAEAQGASTTPAMIRVLPPGSRLTVRAADGSVVRVDLARAPEPPDGS